MIWVPGHHGVEGNEKDEECPVIGSSLNETMACNDVLTPLDVVSNKIDDWALMKVITRCFTIDKNSDLVVFEIGHR